MDLAHGEDDPVISEHQRLIFTYYPYGTPGLTRGFIFQRPEWPGDRAMSDPEKLGKVAGILAFVFCLAAGGWILSFKDVWSREGDALWLAFGLYFIGKAFFAGPMLYLTGQMAARGSR